MDLDSFKDVNDTLGHQVGDQVLVAVAARLAANLREGDFLARLGGDEFAVVVPETGVKAIEFARRLLGSLHGPVEVDGVAVTVRASAGLVTAPEDGTDVGTLLRRAESAMYSAKDRDSRVQSYAGDDQGAARRLALAGQLPAALAGPEVQVHYQPTVELAAGPAARWWRPWCAGTTPCSGRSRRSSSCPSPSSTGSASSYCAGSCPTRSASAPVGGQRARPARWRSTSRPARWSTPTWWPWWPPS